MIRTSTAMSTLVFFSLCSTVLSTAQQPSKEQKGPKNTAQELRNKLSHSVNLEKGIEANTPLRDAIEFISERFAITIVLDNVAFKADQSLDSADDIQVRLPRMVGIKLGTVLQALAAQVNANYLIRGDHILITTPNRVSPLAWQQNRQFAPTIDAQFTNEPLNTSLRRLSDESGISIVLDGGLAEQAKAPVTAILNGVPIDTAVDMLANMVGLKMVVRDRALYVTSKEKAREMESEKNRALEEGRNPF